MTKIRAGVHASKMGSRVYAPSQIFRAAGNKYTTQNTNTRRRSTARRIPTV